LALAADSLAVAAALADFGFVARFFVRGAVTTAFESVIQISSTRLQLWSMARLARLPPRPMMS
jgi:hypothetical protein